jgi:hypothetical protein
MFEPKNNPAIPNEQKKLVVAKLNVLKKRQYLASLSTKIGSYQQKR